MLTREFNYTDVGITEFRLPTPCLSLHQEDYGSPVCTHILTSLAVCKYGGGRAGRCDNIG